MPHLAPVALGLVGLCKNWWNWRRSRDFVVLLFLDTSKLSAACAKRCVKSVPVRSVPVRSVPVRSVPTQRATRLCRPKAGQSLVHYKYLHNIIRTFVKFLDQSIYAFFCPAPPRPADFHLRPATPRPADFCPRPALLEKAPPRESLLKRPFQCE